jgi:hypothetical protein
MSDRKEHLSQHLLSPTVSSNTTNLSHSIQLSLNRAKESIKQSYLPRSHLTVCLPPTPPSLASQHKQSLPSRLQSDSYRAVQSDFDSQSHLESLGIDWFLIQESIAQLVHQRTHAPSHDLSTKYMRIAYLVLLFEQRMQMLETLVQSE